MKVLVVGNGGREHALAWKLLQCSQIEQCFCTPGNGGTASLEGCENLSYAVDDFPNIADSVEKYNIDMVVVGPEVPLAKGITDYLQRYNIKVFGPTQVGAQIESSKSWAKKLMATAGVAIAEGETFTDAASAKAYISQQGAPIVVKADHLAAGKGVIVAQTLEEANAAVDELIETGFSSIVVEEFLQGEEVSILAVTDGKTVRPLLPAQDHKRIGEGDTGPNTGGMGAYAPAPLATPTLLERVQKEILEPTVSALRQKGISYCGVLYAGLMVTPEGDPKILEYNCRFGDPETQAVLPLLKTPLDELLMACIGGRLEEFPPLQWYEGSAVCVVAASEGYPGNYEKGKVITGIQEAEELGSTVFQAGTKLEGDRLLTDGGRVLGVTSLGKDFQTAIARVYNCIEAIDFPGNYYRRDIGHRVR
ncbi:phosphoribosylamine--glycine ligase [Crocosphaera sp. Alani8]|uniref:phosphoribosylamine--glycine ligase n=1 Tax=Crocosphaera sp. Alani8 TaxID=3038952 RepID=UPI00313AF363